MLTTGGDVLPPALVAVGASGKIATSLDGVTWNQQTHGLGTPVLFAVTWSPELKLFVAVGGSSTIATSPDGVTWTAQISPTPRVWTSVAWSPTLGLFVAVAQSDYYATSPDGVTWTGGTVSSAGITWNSVRWAPALGKFIAVGSQKAFAYSSNGTAWTWGSGYGSGVFREVTWSPTLSLLVAVGDYDNPLWTSPDGSTWTSRTTSSGTAGLYSVAWSPALGKFLYTRNRYAAASSDGINWGAEVALIASGYDANEAAWSAELGVFAVVLSNGSIVTSPDASAWTSQTSSFGSTAIYGVCATR